MAMVREDEGTLWLDFDDPSAAAPRHHSDRGVQYLALRYTERLADAGIAPSVGTVGDCYDNALAESVIELYKTEVIRRQGPWRRESATSFAARSCGPASNIRSHRCRCWGRRTWSAS